jgi:WD40 repeat protein
VTDIAFSPDGTTFASSSIDNQVILWKWTSSPASLDVQKILKGHTGYVTSIAFSPDGNLLASAGFDNSIILWNTGQGEQVGPPLNIHSGAINSIAFGDDKDSSTGLYLISGSDDSTLIKWDLSSRQPVSRTFKQESVLTTQQLETKNGKYTATVSGQQIDVNDLLTRDSLFVITDFNTPVDYVGFQADKLRTIDQLQRITDWITEWTIDPGNWAVLACNAVKRNLTKAEWTQYLPNQTYQKTCAQYP